MKVLSRIREALRTRQSARVRAGRSGGQKMPALQQGLLSNEQIFELRLAVLRCFTCNEGVGYAPSFLRGLQRRNQTLRCCRCHTAIWITRPPIGFHLN